MSNKSSKQTKSILTWRNAFLLYIGLLLLSHLYRYIQPTEYLPGDGQKLVSLAKSDTSATPEKAISISYYDEYQGDDPNPPVLMVLHGSPVGTEMLGRFINSLSGKARVLAPDYPGYRASGKPDGDYSVESFAKYLLQFMDVLQVKNVHLIAYSLGGGVAPYMAEMAPERIQSIAMVSAIGVQEFELLGDYHLNHAVHGGQLALIWLFHEAIPHFGFLDHFPLNIPYARSFYDTDQRPIRDILKRYEKPMLIIHGKDDALVPIAAAREHYRIVPQSEIHIQPSGGHGLVMGKTRRISPVIHSFVARVDSGLAITRTNAPATRITEAAKPLTAREVKKAEGITLFVFIILIALATFISEDLACIGAGLMAARGIIGFWPAVFASFLGIFVGDMLLYLVGKTFGKSALKYPPLKWMIKGEDVLRSRRWFQSKGPAIILASRFLPGSRLPTYFAAGALEAGFWMFTFYFVVAAALWTPLLVGLAMLIGQQLLDYYEAFQQYALWVLLFLILFIWLILKLIVPLFTYRGRRLLYSSYLRLRHWEFWPLHIFYIPVVLYILYLGLRHRSFTLFTAANPAIPDGGVVGESKSAILQGLQDNPDFVAAFRLLSPNLALEEQCREVESFMADTQLGFPIVLKPDQGERGSGVSFANSEAEVKAYLATATLPVIAQAYVQGAEYGVFYYRLPNQETGHIYSVTDKQFLHLTGNGKDTLEKLILNHPRAICMARFHLQKHADHLYDIPVAGEDIPLVNIGTHSRGAIFLDGMDIITPALTASIEKIAREYRGFFFGRFDIRTPSLDDFRDGKNFKIVELNGVTSEATHIYDPKNSLWDAYKTLWRQWEIAFEIGQQNRLKEHSPTPVFVLLKTVFQR